MRKPARIALVATVVASLCLGSIGMTTGIAKVEPARRCTPGYSPCIPPGSDVDCRGGSGNGPRYTRRGVVYRVFGYDRYGLDADNDGKGCE